MTRISRKGNSSHSFSSWQKGQNNSSHSSNSWQKEDTDLWALKDVSGISGRNGAGKSTLLKILSRITEPTGGRAEIHGRVGSLLEVGTGFHPELTGRENIYLNGAILGMRRHEIARQFDEIVAFAEIERFLDTPVKAPRSVQRHAQARTPGLRRRRPPFDKLRTAPGAGDLS